jgi:hypothetical protein
MLISVKMTGRELQRKGAGKGNGRMGGGAADKAMNQSKNRT